MKYAIVGWEFVHPKQPFGTSNDFMSNLQIHCWSIISNRRKSKLSPTTFAKHDTYYLYRNICDIYMEIYCCTNIYRHNWNIIKYKYLSLEFIYFIHSMLLSILFNHILRAEAANKLKCNYFFLLWPMRRSINYWWNTIIPFCWKLEY